MQCEIINDLIPEFFDSAVEMPLNVQQHLRSCQSCSHEQELYSELRSSLLELKDLKLKPSRDLYQEIIAGLDKDKRLLTRHDIRAYITSKFPKPNSIEVKGLAAYMTAGLGACLLLAKYLQKARASASI